MVPEFSGNLAVSVTLNPLLLFIRMLKLESQVSLPADRVHVGLVLLLKIGFLLIVQMLLHAEIFCLL